jgi:radical SAM protein with 4Fe4S-binding SPASM domain
LREEQVPVLNRTLKSLRKKKHELKFKINLFHIESYTAETFCKGIFPPFPCHWCTTVATLTPSGDVVPCPNYTGFILGNMNQDESLDAIWGNEKHRRFLKQQKSGALRICRQCSMRHSYPGVREKFRHTFYHNLYTPFRR